MFSSQCQGPSSLSLFGSTDRNLASCRPQIIRRPPQNPTRSDSARPTRNNSPSSPPPCSDQRLQHPRIPAAPSSGRPISKEAMHLRPACSAPRISNNSPRDSLEVYSGRRAGIRPNSRVVVSSDSKILRSQQACSGPRRNLRRGRLYSVKRVKQDRRAQAQEAGLAHRCSAILEGVAFSASRITSSSRTNSNNKALAVVFSET